MKVFVFSALAYSVGGVVYVPWIWTVVTTTQRIQAAQRLTGNQTLNGWLAAFLWILTFAIGRIAYTQSDLNELWKAQRRQRHLGGPQSARLRKLEEPGRYQGDHRGGVRDAAISRALSLIQCSITILMSTPRPTRGR
jgi:hypothetical protein